MESEEQPVNNRPWLFQPGKSGNPGGRPKGTKSLKTYVKEMFLSMTDEEKLEYLKGLPKDKIWEMGEDRAGQGVQLTGEIVSKVIKLDIE